MVQVGLLSLSNLPPYDTKLTLKILTRRELSQFMTRHRNQNGSPNSRCNSYWSSRSNRNNRNTRNWNINTSYTRYRRNNRSIRSKNYKTNT